MTNKQIFALLKVRWLNDFKMNYVFDQALRTKQSVAMVAVFVFVYLVMVAQLALYSYQIISLGLAAWLPYVTFLLAHLILLNFNAFIVYGEFIAFKDYDFLRSLPISVKGLIFSRFLYVYLLESLAVLLISPASLMTWAVVGGQYAKALFWVLGLSLLAPLLTIGISLIIAILAVSVSQFFKQSKTTYNVANLVLVLLMSLLPIVGSLRYMNLDVSDFFGPRIWFILARIQSFQIPMSQADSIIGWIGLSIGLIIVALFLLYKLFDPLTMPLMNQPSQVRKASRKSSSPLIALIKKEWQLFLSLPIYFMNTAFMIISLPVALLTLLFIPDSLRLLVLSEIDDYVPYIAIILGGLVAMTNTTAVSLSLEGKHINWLLSLPITSAMIYRSKVYFNLILFIPPTLISSALTIYVLKLDGLAIGFTLLIPIIFVVFSSWLGMLLNSYFQNYLWDNERQVVKQSVAVLLNLLIIFAICALAWVLVNSLAELGSVLLIVGMAGASVIIKQLLYRRPIRSI